MERVLSWDTPSSKFSRESKRGGHGHELGKKFDFNQVDSKFVINNATQSRTGKPKGVSLSIERVTRALL